MGTVTIDAITEKLKNAPSSILEKIWGYADALLENNERTYLLICLLKNKKDNY